MAGGDEAAVSIDKDTTARESKYKLWTALVTLAGVLVGFIYTGVQLYSQSHDLQRIEQNFRNLDELKKAITMPLEGLWDYKTEYTKYFGEQTPHRHLKGKAVFLWYGDTAPIGYHAYIGGGIYEFGKAEPIVTIVIEFFLETDKSGNPKPDCSATGSYIARTTSEPKFDKPGDTDLELKDGKFEESSVHTINKMTFTFKANEPGSQTDALITFTRPHHE